MQRAVHYVSSRRRSRAAVLVPSRCVRQQCHCLSLWLKPQVGAAVAGAGERLSRASGGVVGQHPTPSPRAFSPLQMARGRPARGWQQCQSRLGPHHACAVGRSRRRPDAVAAWPLLMGQAGVCQWQVVAEPKTAECAQPGHASSTPRRRVVHRTQSRRAKGQGEGSVRTGKTRTLRIPARYGLGQI